MGLHEPSTLAHLLGSCYKCKELMSKFLTRERFGTPQYIAAFLLLIFLAQCGWFISRAPLNQVEAGYIQSGLLMLNGAGPAGDQYRSPLVSLLSAVPASVLVNRASASASQGFWPDQFFLDQHRWIIRAPFLMMGLLLGASVWYVARRLFGNPGGYIALALYVFSPAIIARSSLVGPQIPAAWGAFGLIFTGIAVAHTLYAPREVIFWNWRRIILLGISIALAIGSQFALWVVLPIALGFMLWAVPHRRGAALAILCGSTLVAALLLWSTYFLKPLDFFSELAQAQWLGLDPRMLLSSQPYRLTAAFMLRDLPAPTLLLLVALGAFIAWKRPRFFGNFAPLIVFAALLLLSFAASQGIGLYLLFVSLPFLMVFVSGVFADLLESSRGTVALGISIGVLGTHALLSVIGLVQLASGR